MVRLQVMEDAEVSGDVNDVRFTGCAVDRLLVERSDLDSSGRTTGVTGRSGRWTSSRQSIQESITKHQAGAAAHARRSARGAWATPGGTGVWATQTTGLGVAWRSEQEEKRMGPTI